MQLVPLQNGKNSGGGNDEAARFIKAEIDRLVAALQAGLYTLNAVDP
jgi:hypothetical protein